MAPIFRFRGLIALVLSGVAALAGVSIKANARASAASCPKPSINKVRWSFESVGYQMASGNFWVSYDAGGQTGTVELLEDRDEAGSSPFIFPTKKATTLVSNDGLSSWTPGEDAIATIMVKLGCGSTASIHLRVRPPRSGQKLFDLRQSSWCSDYTLIDTRGSGEPAGLPGAPGGRFIDRFEEEEAGSTFQVETNPYPAVGGRRAMVAAWAKVPFSAYHRSVVKGKQYLKAMLVKAAAECPDTPIYLTGYSQGAQVVADVYQQGQWPLVQGVALFGDPYFNPADPVDRGDFSRRQYGILGRRPLFGKAARGTVLSYCHPRDPVCQGLAPSSSWSQHENYDWLPDGSAVRAANWFGLPG